MTKQIRVQLAAICSVLLLLCIQECLGIKDCTGADCPVLDNCIEEVLEEGACCATCMLRGCTCEGYQYYDCNKEGFRNGKVPEGRSYFVDSGSTECSCPKGGGKIECHFIPCPEIPANCIALSEPTESCPHCLRIGCIFRDQKYEAGHSFHMDPCQVCHCPKDGGNLMCSPVPNCESELVKEPTEDNRNELHVTKHEVPVGLPTKQHPIFNSNLIPVYTERTSEFDEMEVYDYFLETNSTSSPDSSLQLSSPLSPKTQSPWDGLHLGTRKELKENLGTSDAGSEAGEPMSSPSPMVPTTTAGQTVTSRQDKTPEKPAFQQETVGGVTTQQIQTERPDLSRASTHVHLDEEDAHSSIHHRNGERHDHHHRGKHLDTKVQSTSPEHRPSLKTQSSPTTPALREREPQRTSQTIAQKEEKDRNDLFTELESQGVPSRMKLNICCEAGEKWASTQGNCINMEPTRLDPISMCWIVQSQCCRGSLRERKCLDGLRAAREGRRCGADGDVCGTDSYKECCSCCALGLSLQRDGGQCEAPQGLGQSCRNILLTCCLGTDTTNHSVIRERVQPQPTTPPRRVSDRQAMSLDEEADVENAVEKEQEIEGLQDMDECAIYEGQLCQQKCINKPGSYTCTCFSGYTLQPDGSTCLKDAENSLKEHDPSTTIQSLEEKPTTPSSDLLDPCEGKGPCAQLCSPVAGQPLCSCFPGFSLMADGYSCKDINECTLGTHNCGLGFDCINKEGSFSCRATLRCPGGFTLDARGQCGDIDECRTLSQSCSSGFNCVNTVGSYTCQRKIVMCGRGYHASPDGTRCIDVDECQTGVHHCGEGQLCHNLPGTYRCDCSVGYQYDMFRRTCVDVNECWRYPGRLCAQTCENTPGSYHCSCTSGFTLSSDGKNCEDVNECQKNPCSQECANVYGSFQCYCKQGYYLREDSLTCDDIDECSQSIGHLCSFKCVNIPGSYHCACPEHGYSMSPNGHSCRDIDECALRAHNCSVEERCYNIQGGFRCLSFHCPPNYRRISDTRCERISCANFVECQSTPVRITYYQLTFQTNIIIPAQIFRIGPSPAYSGDNIIITIVKGNEEGYFSTRKLNSYMGAIYLHRQVQHPRDFFIDVEMKLWRQGTFTTFLARMYVFITANIL